jgi:hypothetical protein
MPLYLFSYSLCEILRFFIYVYYLYIYIYMYVCMYVCIYIYVYIYIHTYIHIHITYVIHMYIGSEACVLWGVLSRDYGGLGQYRNLLVLLLKLN